MTVLFLNTKFTSIESPKGLSISLVADQPGLELYLEADLQTLPGRLLEDRCSEFARKHVLPQFRRRPRAVVHPVELGRCLGAWLLELDEPKIEVAHECRTDLALLENWLRRQGAGGRPARDALARLVPVQLDRLVGAEGVEAARESSWEHSMATDGIGRHHALADARALKEAVKIAGA